MKLYRERMRREHPGADRREIESLVRTWLTAPRLTRGCVCRRESTVATLVEQELRRAVADLDALRVRWALVGGLAISVRSVPRFTKDLDLAVAVVNDSEAEDVVLRLRSSQRAVASVPGPG